MKRMASANANSKSNSSRSNRARVSGYVMCVDNSGYPVSLEVGKVYRVLPSGKSGIPGWLRLIDETGEDYLFPARRFVRIELSSKGKRALAAARSL